jgi:aldose 1-epimerase
LVTNEMKLQRERFGQLPDGREVDRYILDNGRIELRAITYGGIITSLAVPDRHARRASIVLGHDHLEPYLANRPYLGAVIGRYANRIARAAFELDGRIYQLSANEGANHLHGGLRGFDHHLWAATAHQDATAARIVLTRTSVDGEEGYPGEVHARVTYTLTTDDDVTIEYEATTSAATVVNLTQHTYFDLSAGAAADVLSHQLTIDADSFVPVDETLIPAGAVAGVSDTPFDFRTATSIGARIGADHEQLKYGRGYDHTWVLRKPTAFSRAAFVREPASGRTLQVWTSEPGLQFYSGNQLDGSIIAAAGRVLRRHAGFCLETQHFPNSPNRPDFPSTVVRPAQTYRSRTVWRFVGERA